MTPATFFYVGGAIAAVWLVLLWGTRVDPGRRSRRKLLFGVVAVALLLIPLGNLPLWNRAFSFFPNPSVPLIGLIYAALWQRLLGVPVFRNADWTALWLYGAAGGTTLYLLPMTGVVDLYYWGWGRDRALFALATVTVVMLASGSRIGVLVFAALIAFALNALESRNAWDYVMDPVYWLISLGVLAKRSVMWARRRSARLFSTVVSRAALRPVPEAKTLVETNPRT